MRLTRWLARSALDPSIRGWLALCLGLGALPLPLLGAGLLGFHAPGGLVAMLGVLAMAGGGRRPGGRFGARDPLPGDPVIRAALLVAAGAAALAQVAALIAGFAPAQVSDEFVAHLGVPAWWSAHHRIVPQPGNVFSAFPAGASLLYAPWVATGAAFGTAWPHLVAGWLAAGGVWLLTRDRAPVIRALTTLAALTLPAVWIFAGRAFADLFPVALGAAAVVAAGRGRAGLAGAAVGLAAGTKYQAWLLLPMVAALVPLRRWPLFLAGAVGGAAPWLLRGLLQYGDPLHPLLWRWCGQTGWDALLAGRVDRGLHQDLKLAGLEGLPALPWMIPVRTLAAGADGTAGILAALLVPALWLSPRPREAAALAVVALAATLTGSGLRFLFPALPLVAVVAARGWDRAAGALPARTAALLGVTLTGWQALELVPAGWRTYEDPLPVALGTERVAAYRDRTAYPRECFPPGWFRAAAPAATPGRILRLGSWGGAADAGRPGYITPLFDRPLPVTLVRGAASPDRVAVRFRQAGIGPILVSRWRGEVYFDNWKCWDWSTRELIVWSGFWDRYAMPGPPAAVESRWWSLHRSPATRPHRLTPGFEDEVLRVVLTLAHWDRAPEGDGVLRVLHGLFPGNPDYHAARAVIAGALGRRQEAVAAAAVAERLAPRSAAAARARAAVALAAGRPHDAADALREAAGRNPWEPYAWIELSVLCHRLGRASDAWWATHEYRRAKSGGPEW